MKIVIDIEQRHLDALREAETIIASDIPMSFSPGGRAAFIELVGMLRSGRALHHTADGDLPV